MAIPIMLVQLVENARTASRSSCKLRADIAATFDAQYQQDIRDLGQFQTVYERETREIVRVLQANASDVMPTMDLTSYQEKLALLESNFEINRQRIAEKVKEPSKTVSLRIPTRSCLRSVP